MNWMKKMMVGRYGTDQMNIFLLLLSIILTMISQFLHSEFLYLVAVLPMVYCLFRMFSRDISRRAEENRFFSALWAPIGHWFVHIFTYLKESTVYRHLKCPNCAQKIRVPRKKGKIQITCPACHEDFIKKT